LKKSLPKFLGERWSFKNAKQEVRKLSIEKMRRRYWLVALFLVSGAFSLSLVATVARGPLIGCAFGLVVAVIIAFRSGRIHQRRSSMTVVFAGIALFGLGTGKIGRSI